MPLLWSIGNSSATLGYVNNHLSFPITLVWFSFLKSKSLTPLEFVLVKQVKKDLALYLQIGEPITPIPGIGKCIPFLLRQMPPLWCNNFQVLTICGWTSCAAASIRPSAGPRSHWHLLTARERSLRYSFLVISECLLFQLKNYVGNSK